MVMLGHDDDESSYYDEGPDAPESTAVIDRLWNAALIVAGAAFLTLIALIAFGR